MTYDIISNDSTKQKFMQMLYAWYTGHVYDTEDDSVICNDVHSNVNTLLILK